jgi:hypothetical protein
MEVPTNPAISWIRRPSPLSLRGGRWRRAGQRKRQIADQAKGLPLWQGFVSTPAQSPSTGTAQAVEFGASCRPRSCYARCGLESPAF